METIGRRTDEYRRAQQQVLAGSDLECRWIEVGAGHDVRLLNLTRGQFREDAAQWVGRLLDALGLDRVALAGHSMGGLWALWYALARPERVASLVLLAPPQLPGTRCPFPFRVMATPVLFRSVQRVSPPSSHSSLQFAKMMGEGDTLVDHPDLIDVMVAAGKDPVIASTNVNEARAIISPLALVTPSGFRRDLRLRPDELGRISARTLLIWGDREPLGTVQVAKDIARLMPNATLEVVRAGHAPWIGEPDLTAKLINEFACST